MVKRRTRSARRALAGRGLALAALVVLAGCAGLPRNGPAPPRAPQAPLAPPTRLPLADPGVSALRDDGALLTESLYCAQTMLARTAVMAEPAPIERGWRLRLRVWASPPAGWLDKGSIVHDGARIAYIPDGATRGLAEEEVRDVVRPVLKACR